MNLNRSPRPQRQLAELPVVAVPDHDIIHTIQGWTFAPRRRVNGVGAAWALGSGFGLLLIALAIFLTPWLLLAVPVGVLAPPLKLTLPKNGMRSRRFGTTATFSGVLTQEHDQFRKLCKLQGEVRDYLSHNTTTDLHRERFNELTYYAEKVLTTLLAAGPRTEREDRKVVSTCSQAAGKLSTQFDQLYRDVMAQHEVDPTGSAWGELLASVTDIEAPLQEGSRSYTELNATYQRYLRETRREAVDELKELGLG